MRGRITASIATTAIAGLVPVSAALAGGDDVRSTGKCSGSSTAKIKVKPDNGRLDVEFEVDQNRNGVKWRVRIKDNGETAFRGTATTRAPSGSFSLERRIDDLAGRDTIKGIGSNPASGERCVAEVRI